MSRRHPRSWEKVAGAGAVLAAAAASMCCILPFALGASGLSGAVAAAFFAPLRPSLLVLAAALVAAGFYLSRRTDSSDEGCRTSASGLARRSRGMLFVAALATVTLAFFPSLVGFASGASGESSASVRSERIELRVEGMTCEACASGLRARLLDVPGVIDAAVSHERKTARVRVRAERAPELARLLQVVEEAGYTATPAAPEGGRTDG